MPELSELSNNRFNAKLFIAGWLTVEITVVIKQEMLYRDQTVYEQFHRIFYSLSEQDYEKKANILNIYFNLIADGVHMVLWTGRFQ